MTIQFQVGEIYATRSICDSECVYSFVILSRTAKSVTVKVHGKTVRRGLSVSTYDNAEQFKPFGNYSMCAVISAAKPESAVVKAPAVDPDAQAERDATV